MSNDYSLGIDSTVGKLKKGDHIFTVDFGKDKEDYINTISKNDSASAVVIKDGYVPDKDVEAYFAAADICVCPYESATQRGIVQIAFGFELPVLATNVGGLPEVVTNMKTGYVVEPNNPTKIAEAINDFYENDRRYEFIEHVKAEEKRFSWNRMVECISDLYDDF